MRSSLPGSLALMQPPGIFNTRLKRRDQIRVLHPEHPTDPRGVVAALQRVSEEFAPRLVNQGANAVQSLVDFAVGGLRCLQRCAQLLDLVAQRRKVARTFLHFAEIPFQRLDEPRHLLKVDRPWFALFRIHICLPTEGCKSSLPSSSFYPRRRGIRRRLAESVRTTRPRLRTRQVRMHNARVRAR